ncbi:MAG: CYTH domain-containing protein [Phycisphaerales bacterium]
MQNLEWKSELRDPNLARLICQQINAQHVGKIRQKDTYYSVARGRLKKREAVAVERGIGSPEPVEYIFYERPNEVSPKISEYQIYTHEEVQERFGTNPLNEWIVISKVRELYLVDIDGIHCRLHIDDVRELGWHFEFEILINSAQDGEGAQGVAQTLLSTFRPATGEPIRSSYCELMEVHQGLQ